MIPLAQIPSGSVSPANSVTYPRLSQRISLVSHNRSVLVAVEDIVWLEGSGNYTFIHTRDKRRYLMAKTLKMFQRELSGATFLRIHKSHVVNVGHIRHADFGDNACVEMTGGQTLSIARRRVTATLNQFVNHLQIASALN